MTKSSSSRILRKWKNTAFGNHYQSVIIHVGEESHIHGAMLDEVS